jgi:hypothetical protein
MREKKFHFQEIIKKNEKPEIKTASIYKNGQLVIPRGVVNEFGLDKTVVKFVFDPMKKALGFKKLEGNLVGKLNRTTKMLRQNKLGNVSVGVGRILKDAGFPVDNYPSLRLDTYNDIMERQTIHYMIIRKKNVKA